jgi:hypothetical protein
MHVFDGHRAFSGYCQYWAWFVTCNARFCLIIVICHLFSYF